MQSQQSSDKRLRAEIVKTIIITWGVAFLYLGFTIALVIQAR